MGSDAGITAFREETASSDPPSNTAVPRVGDIVADKYRVDSILGVGGMGVVLAVTHLALGERYAIKCLVGSAAADPQSVARFMHEARAAARIKSEHVARVSDVGQLANGTPYLLMEHLTGKDLDDVLKEHGPLDVGDAVEFVLQACVGVAEAHAVGIVHRDLKPSNLFLTQRSDGAPLVKVLDFGISKSLDQGGAGAGVLTGVQSVFGSPAYMSPEQIRSARNVDFRTDVWALGVILHELLAGELPFKADSPTGFFAAISADEPASVRARRPDVSAGLEAVIRRALEKDVDRRYASVSALAEALEPFRGGVGHASVGRIRRLATPAVPLAQLASVPPSSRRVSVPAPAPGGAIATSKAWTTGGLRPSRGRTMLVATTSLAFASALGLLVWHTRTPPRGERPSSAPASVVSDLTPLESAPSSSSTSTPPPPLPSANAPSPPSASVAIAAPSARALPSPRSRAAASTIKPASTGTSSPSPAPSPTQRAPIDPTAESH